MNSYRCVWREVYINSSISVDTICVGDGSSILCVEKEMFFVVMDKKYPA